MQLRIKNYELRIAGLLLCLVSLSAQAVDRYWVGGTGNTTDTAHWSATSGGAGSAGVPNNTMDVYFDSLSNATAYTVTVNGTLNCLSFTMNGPLVGAVTWAGTSTIQCAGNFNLAGGVAGITRTHTGGVTFTATSGTKTITSNSVILGGSITINGSGGTFQLVDALTTNGSAATFALQAGTFDGNSQTVSMTGAGAVNVTGAVTFANFTRTGTAIKTDSLTFNTNIICTGTFTCTGNSAINRMLLTSNTIGTARTITAATATTNATDFRDITGAGAGDWDESGVSNYSGDCGGNSGMTFTTNATQTATGTASFTWSTHGWTSRVPLPQDNVTINNAFVSSQTVTADMPRLGKTITFGCTGSPIFSNSTAQYLYGGLDLTGVGSMSGTNGLIFSGRTSNTLTSAGVTFTPAIFVEAPGGTILLADNFNSTGSLNLTSGTFDARNGSINANVTATSWLSTNTNTRALIVGSGVWSLTTSGITVWNMATATNFTLTRGSAITCTYSGGTGTRTISHGNSAGGTEANSPDIAITAGTDTVVFSTNSLVRNINYTGFSGTLTPSALTVYGNATFASTMTITANGTLMVFGATSGTQVLTSATKNLDFLIAVNATGATVQLADALAMGAGTSRGLTLTAGTFDLNDFTMTHFGTVTIGAGSTTRVFDFGSGTYNNTLTTAATTVWTYSGTNFSTLGTGTIKLSGSHTGVQTFVGGGATYPNIWYTNATSAEFNVTGSNTFTDFKCTDTNTQAIKFTAGTTTTCATFTVSGAAANPITIGSITAATHTLVKTGSSNIDCDYLSVSYSIASPVMKFYAGNNSVNNGNNTAWYFFNSRRPRSMFTAF